MAVQQTHPRIVTKRGQRLTIPRRIKHKHWKRTLKKANISLTNERLTDPTICKQELVQAWRLYNTEKKHSKHHQTSHLNFIAERQARNNQIKLASEIKQLLLHEEQWNQARTIKYILQKQKTAGFSYVTTTQPDGTTVEHHEKQDMEQSLCAESKRKYQLTYQMPITNTPLKEDFGLDGLSQKTINVAEGTYIAPTQIDKGIKEWITLMEKTPEAKKDRWPLQKIQLSKFKAGWRKANMNKGSNTVEPSYSKYKAMAINDTLATVKLFLLNIPLHTG